MDTEEPTSVENGAHWRTAPAPVRGCFAGAGGSVKFVPPGRHRSSEDRVGIRAQFRPTFARRRKTDTVVLITDAATAEMCTLPVPVALRISGAGARANIVPPGSRCSTEDSIRLRA